MVKLKTVQEWHKQIVEWELLNPDQTLYECALYFNSSPQYIGAIRRTDAFKAYRAERMKEYFAAIDATVLDKMKTVADLSVDIVLEKLEKEREKVGLVGARDTAKFALEAMGYYSKGTPGVVINQNQVNISAAPRDVLEAARAKILERGQNVELQAGNQLRQSATIDGTSFVYTEEEAVRSESGGDQVREAS